MPKAFPGLNPGDLLGRAGQGNPGFLPDVFWGIQNLGYLGKRD